ncbi:MAG: Type 1 glutamine amidotransferase-like domain-containing protein [Candidatus Magasanikbacteria bacterium]
MTKFILHGGETSIPNEHNKKFYQEWIKDFSGDKVPFILLVYFSRPDETWQKLEKSDKDRFAKFTNDRKAEFVVANKDMNKFKKQIQEADIIYFRGGEPQKIVDTMSAIKGEFLSLINGKIYAGSSAGVMFLSGYSKSPDKDWQKWLGLLPVNSIVHYSEKFKDGLEEFKKNHPDNKNEYILLPESEFVVRNY